MSGTPCELLFGLSVTDLENNMADIAIAMGHYDDETTLDQIWSQIIDVAVIGLNYWQLEIRLINIKERIRIMIGCTKESRDAQLTSFCDQSLVSSL